MNDEDAPGASTPDRLDSEDFMTPDETGQPAESPPAATSPVRELSRRTVVICALIGAGLIAWFFFAWLWQGQDIVDAAGESIGSAIVLLLLVSVGGALLKNRRP